MSLACLRDILVYLCANAITMYRMHAQLVPVKSQEQFESFEEQLSSCVSLFEEIADLIHSNGVRLSFHPYSSVILNTPDEVRAARSMIILTALCRFMDRLHLGDEAIIVIHTGGVYRNPDEAKRLFVERFSALPDDLRRRLALENDDRRFCYRDVMDIHRACGIPIVLDVLHHLVLNPSRVPLLEALEQSLYTWPMGVRPKVHFSSPRTELRYEPRSSKIKLPTWTEHSDFVNPFEFIRFMQDVQRAGLPVFDVMLEAKGRDVALLKLRQDLCRFAPELARQFQ